MNTEIPTYKNRKLGGGFTQIPHVVLLGAGASKAAFPNGDLHGKKLPLMQDFVEVLELGELLSSNGVEFKDQNFEVLFNNIAGQPQFTALKTELEERIYSYFSHLKMPTELTIYDHLILSLRDKDIIATFNWDPFLLFAYRRCGNYFKKYNLKLPEIVFLHSNVTLGVCDKDKVLGPMDSACSKCSKRFSQVPLLYPILKKNYVQNLVIKQEWDKLKFNVENAYFVTVFGYGAPDADAEAVSLMHEVWKKNPRMDLAEIELIDICDENALFKRWEKFIVREHYRVRQNIWQSYLFRYPRRSIEAFFDCFLQLSPWHENPMPEFKTFKEIEKWIAPLLNEEK